MHPQFRRLYVAALIVCSAILLILVSLDRSPTATRVTETPAPISGLGSSTQTRLSPSAAFADFQKWHARYERAPEAAAEAMVAEGIGIAERRRDAFLALMRADPDAALREATPIETLASLPDELLPFIERPISGVASIDLRWESTERDGEIEHCEHRNALYIGDQKWELFGNGIREPRRGLPVTGIALGGAAVLADQPVRLLTSPELEAAKGMFPVGNQDSRDPVTGNPAADDVAALIGGKFYYLESAASASYLESAIVRAEEETRELGMYAVEHPFEWLAADGGSGGGGGGGAPVAEGPFQEDSIDVLFIRVDFSDFPGEPVTQGDLESTLDQVKGHVETFSYNVATIVRTVTPGYYRMPNTGASYATSGDNDLLHTHARALAAGAGYTLSNYDVVAVYFPSLSGVSGSKIKYGGLASIGGSKHWINGTNSVGVILHEFGHNYGLYHSNYWDPSQSISGDYDVPSSLEYGDIFDEMGSGSSPEAHFNHFQKNRLQWMPDSKVLEPTASGTYRIYRFDHVDALDNAKLAIKVPMGGGVYYWVGYRQLYTSSSYNLDAGAYIVAEGLSEGAESNLIDATPGSASPESEDRKDAGLEIGSPFVESGVTFAATARGGSGGDEWIDVSITFAGRVGLVGTSVEVDEQAGMAWLTLQRQFSTAGVASVDFATTNGSATAGSDYYAHSGTVTWADGDSANKTIGIPVRPDTSAEGTETFTVTLSSPAGASLDTAANVGTVSILDPGERCQGFAPAFFNRAVDAIEPLPNGQVLIGGTIYGSGDFAGVVNLARLNSDGSVDTTLVTGSGFNAAVNAIAVQSDGKILVGGAFTSYNGTTCNRIVRIESNGVLDSTFVSNIGTGANEQVNSIAVEADGKILVGGGFSSFDGSALEGMVRLTSAGARDTAYPLSLPFVTSWGTGIHAIVVQDDGKIMVGGTFYISGGGGFKSGIARLNASGTRDTTFDPGGGTHADGSTTSLQRVYAIVQLADGKYLIGGRFTAYDSNATPYIARVNANGSFDGTYSPPAFDDDINAISVAPDGRAYVGGDFSSPAAHIICLQTTGPQDSAFVAAIGPSAGSDNVSSVAHDSAGGLYVGGNFFAVNGSSSRPVVKLAGGVSAYDIWVASNFTAAQIAAGDADPTGDPDGDDLDNATEWGLGTSPTVPNASPAASAIASSGGNEYLQLAIDRGATGSGAWMIAQFSDDLVVWTPASPVPGTNAVYDVIEDSLGQFIVRDKTSGDPRRFVRFGGAKPE